MAAPGNVPPEFAHLTMWERYERAFQRADIRDDIEGMGRIWRQAYYFAFQHRKEIPAAYWPARYIVQRTQQGAGVFTNVVGAWFSAMGKWSRERLMTRYRM